MLVETEYSLAQAEAQTPFSHISAVSNLHSAWRKVRANRGVGGIDRVSLADFERDLLQNLSELSHSLLSGTYRPLPARFVNITKANGKTRELGILSVRDRVAQRAVLDSVEHKFEAAMEDCSYAFRVGRNVEMAIRGIVLSRANGLLWTVESDIKDFFPSIDTDILLSDVGRIIPDEQTLGLIRLWLNAGILEETGLQTAGRKLAGVNSIIEEIIADRLDEIAVQRQQIGPDLEDFPMASPIASDGPGESSRRQAAKEILKDGLWLAYSHRSALSKLIGPKLLGVGGLAAAGFLLAPKVIEGYRRYFHPGKGILQGAPLSPVLANYYLTEFDRALSGDETQLVRYCDDFVILCRSEADARNALHQAERLLGDRKLQLHPEKTRIIPPGEEFTFLGFRFLSSGMVEPPPTATAESARKIREMAAKAAATLRNTRLRVTKHKVNSWKEYFQRFGT